MWAGLYTLQAFSCLMSCGELQKKDLAQICATRYYCCDGRKCALVDNGTRAQVCALVMGASVRLYTMVGVGGWSHPKSGLPPRGHTSLAFHTHRVKNLEIALIEITEPYLDWYVNPNLDYDVGSIIPDRPRRGSVGLTAYCSRRVRFVYVI